MLLNKRRNKFIIKDVENLMDRRFQGYRPKTNPIFPVVDEFAALRMADKKEFNEINDSLKRIILMGRSANVHLLTMALQRAETFLAIDGAIRDTYD